MEVDQIRGILTFGFVSIVAILFFIGCSVSNAKKEYEELKFSKEEIEANKALNSFLEMYDEERKVSDVITEAYLNKDDKDKPYDNLNEIALSHFGDLKDLTEHRDYDYWQLRISAGSVKYDSIIYNYYSTRFCTTGSGSKTYIPVVDDNLKLTKLKVTLFVSRKCGLVTYV